MKDNLLEEFVRSYFAIIVFSIFVFIFLKNSITDVVVLGATFLAIIMYTFETYKLRKIQQETSKILKKERTLELLKEFDANIKYDLDFIMSIDEGKLLERTVIQRSENELKEAQKINNVLAYFERAGLANKIELIDIKPFVNNFSYIFPDFYRRVREVIKFQQSINKKIWAEVIDLSPLFEEESRDKNCLHEKKLV